MRLARSLLEAMAGTLELEPDPDGGGYTVAIDLPAARAQSACDGSN